MGFIIPHRDMIESRKNFPKVALGSRIPPILSEISANGKKTEKVLTIKDFREIKITFDGISQPLKIKTEQMKMYKFIYIERRKKNVLIEFNNQTKKLSGVGSPNI